MPPDDLRESLGKAFDAVAAQEAGGSPAEAPPPIAPTPAPSPDPGSPAPSPIQEPGAPPPIAAKLDDKSVTPEEHSDDSGASPAPAPAGAGLKETSTERAPGTWGAAAREQWKDLKPEVRAEIWRREKDVTRALSSSTKARKLADDFEETMKPYLGFIAAENGTPLQAVKLMMNTAAGLRVGTPQQKAKIVYDIINNYNIDLKMLDDMFPDPGGGGGNNGVNQNHQTSAIQAAVDQRLAPLIGMLRQQQANEQRNQQQIEAEVDSELEQMANDPKFEFFNDVKLDMADILEMNARRGVLIPLTDAYQRATLLSEPVRRILESRKGQTEAQRNQQIADKARRTAASVPGSNEASLGITPAAGDNLRATLEAAFAKHAGA